jgi:uncharacterized protein YjeT (DUF2065 family)
MKITEKQLRILSIILFLIGTGIVVMTKNYNIKHQDDPDLFGKWFGIFIMIFGLILLVPWIRKRG